MPSLFTKLNKHQIPYMCILTEGLLTFLYLAISRGQQLPLQQLSSFGCTITYTLSALALVVALWRNPASKLLQLTAWLAVGSCMILLTSCVNSFMLNGMSILIAFLLILILGTVMYVMTKNQNEYDKIGM